MQHVPLCPLALQYMHYLTSLPSELQTVSSPLWSSPIDHISCVLVSILSLAPTDRSYFLLLVSAVSINIVPIVMHLTSQESDQSPFFILHETWYFCCSELQTEFYVGTSQCDLYKPSLSLSEASLIN